MTLDPQHPTPYQIPGLLIVPAVRTPLADVDAAGALVQAYRFVFDADIERRPLCCLLAQCALETGHWNSCWNENWGNVKAADSYRGSATYFRCNEVLAGKIVWFDPFNSACRFRAFDSAASGAEQQMRFLGQSARYAQAWAAALAGDPTGFVDELARAKYFTADPSIYRAAVAHLFQQYISSLPSTLPEDQHQHDPVVTQPVDEHSPMSDIDLRALIESMQLPLAVDWTATNADRDQLIQSEDA